MTKLKYKGFEEWWNSTIEGTNQTWKAAMVNVHGSSIEESARQIWALGWISAEATADGHVAEAAKDVRAEGHHGAESVIKNVTLPRSKKIIDENIQKVAKEAGLI